MTMGSGLGFGGSATYGMWQLFSETILGSATTDTTISGLDLETDKMYWIVMDLVNSTHNDTYYKFFINADTTANHYYQQRTSHDAAVTATSRVNDATVGLMDVNDCQAHWEGYLSKQTGKNAYMHWRGANRGTTIDEWKGVWVCTNNTTNVTSFLINSTQNLAIGTRIRVFRCSA